MDSTLQIRINKRTKEKAKKVFNDLGIDMSSGVKLYLSQVINTGSILFYPTTKNGFSMAKEQEMIEEVNQVIDNKRGKLYKTAEEAHVDILKT
jgi:addiction module RelB/DinJ family antitoxin